MINVEQNFEVNKTRTFAKIMKIKIIIHDCILFMIDDHP